MHENESRMFASVTKANCTNTDRSACWMCIHDDVAQRTLMLYEGRILSEIRCPACFRMHATAPRLRLVVMLVCCENPTYATPLHSAASSDDRPLLNHERNEVILVRVANIQQPAVGNSTQRIPHNMVNCHAQTPAYLRTLSLTHVIIDGWIQVRYLFVLCM